MAAGSGIYKCKIIKSELNFLINFSSNFYICQINSIFTLTTVDSLTSEDLIFEESPAITPPCIYKKLFNKFDNPNILLIYSWFNY